MIEGVFENNTSVVADTLDIESLMKKNITVISTEEALADVIPIQWESAVVNSVKKVVLRNTKVCYNPSNTVFGPVPTR